ncbi:MAG: type II toxin-antitoxin system VapC family toxin [Lewinellaceae bacterium]|nr:type II toxin-antitoxin system VapC family toxin [Saprospiraceae bacterium]MCB9340176.1 type II toxin-antitoxin system VapC family toxin [Lewinellaceae bacterium]
MNRYLLDTHVALAYLFGHPLYQQIEADHQLSDPATITLLSVATKAELLSVAMKNNWEEQQINRLNALLQRLIIIDINEADRSLLEAYAQIDSYSQGRLAGKPLHHKPHSMGSNDLWKAATAYITNSSLITTTDFFDHLSGSFIQLVKYPLPLSGN